MNKQRGKRNRRKKNNNNKLRVACNRTTTPLRRAITSALRRCKERRGKNKNPALTLLHQQDGHSDQHSPVQRVLHVCCCILAQTFIVVVGGENTACDSTKILKSASSPFFSFFFFNSALLLTGWLAGWPTGGYSIHQRCAQPKSLLQPRGRQAGGARGKPAARRATSLPVFPQFAFAPPRHPHRTYFEELNFLPCRGSTTASLKLLSAVATRGGAAVRSLSLSYC